MEATITIERFSDANIEHYEQLTKQGDDGKLCYCSFWHSKWSSMADYDQAKKDHPERLKACVVERMHSHFHVGVIAYADGKPCAWVSVGPLTDFYWAWRRVGQLGDAARTVAAIICITRKTEARDRVTEASLLSALVPYAKQQGWSAIEGYPFDRETLDAKGEAVTWPGFPEDFQKTGFVRSGDHWLNSPEYARSIYRFELS